MASLRQIAANRANAQLSTGPRTLEGKERSSRNRLTHGLCGAHTILPGEEHEEYQHLLDALLEEHAPAGPTEELLVAQLAQAQWKLNRIVAIEADLLAKQLLPNEPNLDEPQAGHGPSLAEAFENASASLTALARHESAARRAFDKALNNLLKLRRDAKWSRDGYGAAAYGPAAESDGRAMPVQPDTDAQQAQRETDAPPANPDDSNPIAAALAALPPKAKYLEQQPQYYWERGLNPLGEDA